MLVPTRSFLSHIQLGRYTGGIQVVHGRYTGGIPDAILGKRAKA
jgi:hypothetical protein